MSRSQLEHLHGDLIGASSLTTAELRLLPLLTTQLSRVTSAAGPAVGTCSLFQGSTQGTAGNPG